MKVLISTTPFAQFDEEPIEHLKKNNFEVIKCPDERKFTPDEFYEKIQFADALIAGTEPLNEKTIGHAKNLKIIARIGIGLDSVDLDYCKRNNILVTYTPDGPSDAVAELSFGLILSLSRQIHQADQKIRSGKWTRITGQLLRNKTLGIIGLGRIGKRVSILAKAFGMKVLVYDIKPDQDFIRSQKLEFSSKENIFKLSDIITIHIPKTRDSINFLDSKNFELMTKKPIIINTSRGGIVNEADLIDALTSNKISGAGLDVFETEPFNLKNNEILAKLENTLLTAHMGSCTKSSRALMESGAARSVVDFFNQNLENSNHYNIANS